MAATTVRGDDGNELTRYLKALAVTRRRHALYYLHKHSVSNVSELAEYVLRFETSRPISEIPEEELQSVQIDLYHNHLPRLAEAGIVSFDKRSKDVRMEGTPMVFRGLLWICHIVEAPP